MLKCSNAENVHLAKQHEHKVRVQNLLSVFLKHGCTWIALMYEYCNTTRHLTSILVTPKIYLVLGIVYIRIDFRERYLRSEFSGCYNFGKKYLKGSSDVQ